MNKLGFTKTVIMGCFLSTLAFTASAQQDHAASFPGGTSAMYKWLAKNISYPKTASAENIQGKVFVHFTVEEDGSLTNLEVQGTPNEALAKEAIKVMKLSPKWMPAQKDGVTVAEEYTVPINFSLAPSDAKTTAVTTSTPAVNNPGMQIASFPGGQEALFQYLAKAVHYPEAAKQKNISGKAYVSFVVETDGSLSNFKLLKETGSGLGEEALRVIKASPKWIPAKQNGKMVRSQYTVPINFKIV